jgi:hypothetical protein
VGHVDFANWLETARGFAPDGMELRVSMVLVGLRVNHNLTPTHQHAFGNFPQILLTAYTVCASAKFGSEHLQDDEEIGWCAEHTNMCVTRKLGFCILAYNNCLLFLYIYIYIYIELKFRT